MRKLALLMVLILSAVTVPLYSSGPYRDEGMIRVVSTDGRIWYGAFEAKFNPLGYLSIQCVPIESTIEANRFYRATSILVDRSIGNRLNLMIEGLGYITLLSNNFDFVPETLASWPGRVDVHVRQYEDKRIEIMIRP